MDAAFGNEDLLQNILSRLTAVSFASAACVSKSWNKACDRILYRPKLASALSLSSSLHVAVIEVLDKVLSEPIRPHFAIAWVGLKFNLAATHRLITEKLGSLTPIITNAASGIIGMDARTNEMTEAKWELLGDAPNIGGIYDFVSHFNYCGIVLVVGYVPGLKVDAIPLLGPKKDCTFLNKSREPRPEMIDKFLTDIEEYTASFSDCTSPDGIIMFGDHRINLQAVLVQMDNKMATETVVVGDASGSFLFKSGDNSLNYVGSSYSFDAVALVFAKDKSSSNGRGKFQFHVTLSTGILPFGPPLKVASVSVTKANCSRLTARVEGLPGILDSWGLLEDIHGEIEDENHSLYIGVTHQKAGSQLLGSRSYMAFYKVLGEAEEYCFAVDGVGIKPGDSFVFYHSDSETAYSSSINAYQDLGILKSAASTSRNSSIINYDHDKKEIIGGLIFSCSSRGESLSGINIIESLPFSTNYPGTPLAGVFCSGEIARVSTSLITLDDEQEEEEEEESSNSGGCFLHHNSTVYLVMSYTPLLQC
ncbi:hypothetical protein ACOSQ4_000110 [Xanthoceras sorbifolium]